MPQPPNAAGRVSFPAPIACHSIGIEHKADYHLEPDPGDTLRAVKIP